MNTTEQLISQNKEILAYIESRLNELLKQKNKEKGFSKINEIQIRIDELTKLIKQL